MNGKTIAARLWVCCSLVVGICGISSSARAQDTNALIRIPPMMATEHEKLHAELAKLAGLGGKTGAAAREVERVLAPHFEEENRYALPPLGLLPALAKSGATEEMRPAIELSRHVGQNLDRFMEEHRNITRALDDLEVAGRAESKAEALNFAAELRAHAQEEEQVLYPTAILIGRYLEQTLGKQ